MSYPELNPLEQNRFQRINELDGILTLARAGSRLDPAKMTELHTVAGLQQK
jgi:hypothetical protein